MDEHEEKTSKDKKVSSDLAPRKTSQASQSKEKQRDPYARAANEDDDGYDPWSDRNASNPFWEEDPWR